MRVERYSAFSDDPEGGNPAGVVLGARGLPADAMQQIAADVGYSESAFVTGPIRHDVPIPIRYFAPEGEVDFCGHATIATAVAIGASVGQGGQLFGGKRVVAKPLPHPAVHHPPNRPAGQDRRRGRPAHARRRDGSGADSRD